MSSRTQINDSDEGKKVVNANGDEVGIVAEVTSGAAHVNPDPDITDSIKSKLGWEEAGADTYMLPESEIEEITDDQIRLSSQT